MDLTTIRRIAAENPALIAIMTVVLAAALFVLLDEYRRAKRFHAEQDPETIRRRHALDQVNREIAAARRAHDR